jgi:hypothetical protein
MTQGMGSLQKKVLQNSAIKLSKRLAILSAYIFTKGTFQCCTWSDLSQTASKKFHSAIMKMYRITIGIHQGNKEGNSNISDDDILYTYGITNPEIMIRTARLSLVARIMCKAPKVMTSLIFDMAQSKIGWPETVLHDLQWLCGAEKFNGRCEWTFEDWGPYIQSNSKYFRLMVRKYSLLRYANAYCPPQGVPSSSEPAILPCPVDGCTFSAKSKQQMAMHAFKVHKVKSIWKNYLGNLLFCPICLKYFHTRERVLNHVRYRSETCRHNLVLRFTDTLWTDNEIAEMDLDEADCHKKSQASGKRRHQAEAPVVQLAGPLQPVLLLGTQSAHHPLGMGHRHF